MGAQIRGNFVVENIEDDDEEESEDIDVIESGAPSEVNVADLVIQMQNAQGADERESLSRQVVQSLRTVHNTDGIKKWEKLNRRQKRIARECEIFREKYEDEVSRVMEAYLLTTQTVAN